MREDLIGIRTHRSKLPCPEPAVVAADADLPVNNGSRRCKTDGEDDETDDRKKQQASGAGQQQIEGALEKLRSAMQQRLAYMEAKRTPEIARADPHRRQSGQIGN